MFRPANIPLDPCGTLVVPKEADIIRGEPAIEAKAASWTFLYSKPLEHAKDDYEWPGVLENDGVGDSKILRLKLKNPPANASATERWVVHQFGLFDTTILAAPHQPDSLSPKPAQFEVGIFQKTGEKIPGIPESGHSIKIKDMGYMFPEDVQGYNQEFKPVQGNIFDGFNPADPNFSVYSKQSWMGNCFLLSVINAINSKGGMAFVNGMMKQDLAKGTTTVRLYDPITLQPVYIEVPTSIHYINGESAVNHSAPWIHMIEKAYAVYARKLTLNKDKTAVEVAQLFSSFLSIYGDGGSPHFAMTVLTGVAGENHSIQPKPNSQLNLFNLEDLVSVAEATKEYRQRQEAIGNNKVKPAADNKFIKYKNEHKEAYSLFTIYENNWWQSNEFLALGDYINSLHTILEESKGETQRLRAGNCLRQFNMLCNAMPKTSDEVIIALRYLPIPPPDSVINMFRSLLTKAPYTIEKTAITHAHHEPGPLGSGHYTVSQLKLWQTLRKHVKEIKTDIVTASTPKEFADEKAAPVGLVANHVYTVLDVPIKNNKLYVELRNPWGNTSRDYDDINGQLVPKATEAPVSCIELSEFTQFFDSYCVGEYPTLPLMGFAKKKEAWKYEDLLTLQKLISAGFREVGLLDEKRENAEPLTEAQRFRIAELAKLDISKLSKRSTSPVSVAEPMSNPSDPESDSEDKSDNERMTDSRFEAKHDSEVSDAESTDEAKEEEFLLEDFIGISSPFQEMQRSLKKFVSFAKNPDITQDAVAIELQKLLSYIDHYTDENFAAEKKADEQRKILRVAHLGNSLPALKAKPPFREAYPRLYKALIITAKTLFWLAVGAAIGYVIFISGGMAAFPIAAIGKASIGVSAPFAGGITKLVWEGIDFVARSLGFWKSEDDKPSQTPPAGAQPPKLAESVNNSKSRSANGSRRHMHQRMKQGTSSVSADLTQPLLDPPISIISADITQSLSGTDMTLFNPAGSRPGTPPTPKSEASTPKSEGDHIPSLEDVAKLKRVD